MLNHELIEAFHQGHTIDAHHLFGAHLTNENGVDGIRFTVWAPRAKNVQVVGPFNDWNGEYSFLLPVNDKGIFSLFVPHLGEWTLYKYRVESSYGVWTEKSDPYGFYQEKRPKLSSIAVDLNNYHWQDAEYLKKRTKNFDKPMHIYEVHLGSWRKKNDEWLTLDELADELIPYVKDNGFTHIELMPLVEHPFDGSWGYQVTGFFSITSRYGTPKEFMRFIDRCHAREIGVILDVVPTHFVKDENGLREFDGAPLYEYPKHEDAHNEWDTLNFNLWKEEVRSFLMSSFNFWVETYHFDGLRFDAVKNMLFWGGDKYRGHNEGALAFIRRSNYYMSERYPDVMLIAEDSSDFHGVTSPTFHMGLGYDYKWDLGWMNDTLRYYALDPIYRKHPHNHHMLTFSMAYFNTERFLLPLSHDEVVHLKKSLINKFWGSYEQNFSQARNLFGYMMAHPGKKLNFMGNEIGVMDEWDEKKALEWNLLRYPMHQSLLRYVRDLNFVYHHHTSLFERDYQHEGFYWIDADNMDQSIYSFVRESDDEVMLIVNNMTDASYENFEVGVPLEGEYLELINSEKDIYSGCNMCNFEPVHSFSEPRHGQPHHVKIRIAPFASIYFTIKKQPEDDSDI